jgi:hypothetical protein
MTDDTTVEHDVRVIGAGGAGLRAASEEAIVLGFAPRREASREAV